MSELRQYYYKVNDKYAGMMRVSSKTNAGLFVENEHPDLKPTDYVEIFDDPHMSNVIMWSDWVLGYLDFEHDSDYRHSDW